MSDKEPSWKRFENHPGPDTKTLHDALVRWNDEKGYRQSASAATNPTRWIGTPRKSKHSRNLRP